MSGAHEKGPAPVATGDAGEAGLVEKRASHRTTIPARPAIEPLLTIGDVCRELACSRRWLEQARAAGRFPRPACLIGRSPRWKRETLVRWIAEGGSR